MNSRRREIHQPLWRGRWLWPLSLAIMLIWYPLVTWRVRFFPPLASDLGLAFNSMAEHLLAGRFDIDPAAIGSEAFVVGGRTVSYFGVFCALLRVPLVLTGCGNTDITWWSCLIAIWIATWFQLRALALVWTAAFPSRQAWLAAALWISVLLGGQHIQFLRPTVYQEPINWAYCQAMAFIFLALRGFTTPRGFDKSTLSWMAVCAGLALLTRVTFGVGLYGALGLLLLARLRPREWPFPIGIALAFAVQAGIVNQGRWGDPFTFADFSRYVLSQQIYPDRLGRLAAYGNFNVARIWFGLGYYFLPIWVWIRADGLVLFAGTQATLIDSAELPPGSFLLTDPLLLLLAGAGVIAVRDRVRAGLLIGLAVPAVLMLCAISMAHRYRMEFYPLFFLAALFGVAAASTREASRRFGFGVIGLVMLGVIAAHAMAVIYARSPLGPGEVYLERHGGLFGFRKHQRAEVVSPRRPSP